jgi:hypothetical protein
MSMYSTKEIVTGLRSDVMMTVSPLSGLAANRLEELQRERDAAHATAALKGEAAAIAHAERQAAYATRDAALAELEAMRVRLRALAQELITEARPSPDLP